MAQPTRAQSLDPLRAPADGGRVVEQTWVGELALALGNAALGGLTAGLTRAFDDGSFWPAFRDGAIGGAVAYAGRRVAVARFDGAGFLGREIAAVGSSLVRNAADGRGRFDRLVLPVALVRIDAELRPDDAAPERRRLRISLDLPTFLATAYYVARDDADFDASASLSAGAPVFDTFDRRADGNWRGEQIAGALRVLGNPGDPLPDHARGDVIAHERVHVLQHDFAQLAWSEPAESWLLARVTGGETIDAYVDLGLHLLPWAAANLLIPHELRPWEQEARFLTGVRAESD